MGSACLSRSLMPHSSQMREGVSGTSQPRSLCPGKHKLHMTLFLKLLESPFKPASHCLTLCYHPRCSVPQALPSPALCCHTYRAALRLFQAQPGHTAVPGPPAGLMRAQESSRTERSLQSRPPPTLVTPADAPTLRCTAPGHGENGSSSASSAAGLEGACVSLRWIHCDTSMHTRVQAVAS